MEIFLSVGGTAYLSFLTFLVSWAIRSGKKATKAKNATVEDCDARQAWDGWWEKNYRSPRNWKSKEGQEVMRRVVVAKIKWAETHYGINGSNPFDQFVLTPKV